jgi:hypothetical protein
MAEDKVDHLEVDEPIPGQNYVCLSFVSPESLMQEKEAFKAVKFLQSYCKDKKLNFKTVYDEYKDFTYKYSDNLQKDFNEQNNFQTNIRGIKVRGVYETKDSAERRAKKLQTLDSDFHVFVGQVGYWLPWDPNADKIEDETFVNSQLNDMMEKYKENTINKDIFYEEEKRDRIKAAREEVIRKKKEDTEKLKQEALADGDLKVVNEDEPSVEEPSVEDPIKEIIDTDEKVEDLKDDIKEVVGNVDEETKQSLDEIDPWMARKMQGNSENKSQ